MKAILIAITLFLLSNVAHAQNRYEYRYGPWGYEYRYEPNVQEWSDDVRERWKLKDELKARREARLQEARERHKQHRETHPPTPENERYFTYKGQKFKNYAEFKKSDAYLEMKFEVEMRQIKREYEQKLAEERLQKAIEFERNRRRYIHSYPDIFRQEDERNHTIARQAMGEWWWKKYEQPELYDEDSASFKITDKIAKKHGITRQQAWEEYPGEISEEMEKLLPPGSYKSYEVLPRRK